MIETKSEMNAAPRIDENALTQSLYLVHYCHPSCAPFQNIMRLPKEEAFALAEKLAKENPNTTAFYRFADFINYYPRRLKTDEYLYASFIRLGGKPRERHPLSFVLQECSYLNDWFGQGGSYQIRLSDVAPDSVSFTLGDSCAQYERTGRIQLLTTDQLINKIKDFESAEAFLRFIAANYKYIEVQLWDDQAVKQSILHRT